MNIGVVRCGRQPGFTLLEVLIAFVVVSVGLLAIGVLQTNVIGGSSQAKIRTEALGIAEKQIEEYRQFLNETSTSWMSISALPASASGTFADYQISYASSATASGEIDLTVTVDWSAFARSGDMSSVAMSAKVAYTDPTTIADSAKSPPSSLVDSPTGRAYLGEGEIELDDIPDDDKVTNDDGTVEVVQEPDRLLVIPDADGGYDNVVLTLENACVSGSCTEFVKISGRIYMDQGMSSPKRTMEDIYVTASDAGYCHLWLPGHASLGLNDGVSGYTVASTNTSNPSYKFANYTCYLGGGWHGNIGILYKGGLATGDFTCMGDPTAADADDQGAYGVRRAYRGMLVSGTEYASIGIRDATELDSHDFVVSKDSSVIAQTVCNSSSGPMKRADSRYQRETYNSSTNPDGRGDTLYDYATLFAGNPADFVCLNEILVSTASGSVQAIDTYGAGYTAPSTCPYDPTNPPLNYAITGTVSYPDTSDAVAASSNFTIDTDGETCVIGDSSTLSFASAAGSTYAADFTCFGYAEEGGSGWSGDVNAQSNHPDYYCTPATTAYSNISSDQTGLAITCVAADSYEVSGTISFPSGVADVADAASAFSMGVSSQGYCSVTAFSGDPLQATFSCVLYDNGGSWSGTISADTSYPGFSCSHSLPTTVSADASGQVVSCISSSMTVSGTIDNTTSGPAAVVTSVSLTKTDGSALQDTTCTLDSSVTPKQYSCTVDDYSESAVLLQIVSDKNSKGIEVVSVAGGTASTPVNVNKLSKVTLTKGAPGSATLNLRLKNGL